ncbi:hypothetical protein GTA08_BOTSDO02042 [Neofusicoccum parvum]|uniref:Celp0028 effector like protein n=2 Tax=Neofusicoccum parvum TaxID=310453 RepID=R1GBJ2_BOTPV|nr:hypothetical protein UCRNP2_10061 [Neofusicoccum parvum UCRNP2]GME27557.1 hypothetical protein GTA08_BOTSDO02042 [Neofusicoccum parvum]GME64338.1 hypothetical protein GTA08_BOTSDO02042 [Neofusicoccum parvum]
MHFSTLVAGLAGASAVMAAAVPKAGPIMLEQDDVILYGEGKTQIMKRHEWQAHEEKRLAALNERVKRRSLEVGTSPNSYAGPLVARSVSKRADCTQGEVEEVQVLKEENFLQWDVVMSPVITARYDQATVAVQKGYSLANSVSVSQSFEVGLSALIESLKTTLQVSFSTTWTTSESQTYSYFLNPTDAGEAMYGAVVSNPVTTRYTGNYIYGCAEAPTTEAWSADVYAEEVKSGELTWVQGAIGLAASTQYPVPCLIGECEHK